MVYHARWRSRCRRTFADAVCREVSEELGLHIEVKDLVFAIEGLHGENPYRVDLVFLCEYKGTIENAILQGDTNQVGHDWLDIKALNTAPLYPSKLRRQIMNLHEGKSVSSLLGERRNRRPRSNCINFNMSNRRAHFHTPFSVVRNMRYGTVSMTIMKLKSSL